MDSKFWLWLNEIQKDGPLILIFLHKNILKPLPALLGIQLEIFQHLVTEAEVAVVNFNDSLLFM